MHKLLLFRRSHLIILLLLIFSFPVTPHAENISTDPTRGTVTIQIENEESHPLQDAVVFINDDHDLKKVTGESGTVSYALPYGTYTVFSYAANYLDRIKHIFVTGDDVTIQMTHRPALSWDTSPENAPIGVGEANGIRMATDGEKLFLHTAFGGEPGTTDWGALYKFYSYDPQTDEWTVLDNSPYGGLYGITTAFGPAPDGDDAIYIMRGWPGGQRTWMARYDIQAGEWQDDLEYNIPWRKDLGNQYSGDGFQDYPRNGAAMVWDQNDHMYLFPGSAYGYEKYDWYRYSVSNDSWEDMDELPHKQGPGNAPVFIPADESGLDQDYIYIQFGLTPAGNYTSAEFWRFGLQDEAWENMKDHAFGADDGSMLAWDGKNYIYHTPGAYVEQSWDQGQDQKRELMRYNVSKNEWTQMENAPYNRWGGWDDAGGIVVIDGVIYGMKGGSDVAWAENEEISGGGDIPSDKLWKFTIPETSRNLQLTAADGSGITWPAPGTYAWPEGTDADLLAIPADEWQFVRWEHNGNTVSEEPAATITLDEDMKIQAIFTPEEFMLYASPSTLTGINYIMGEGPSEAREVTVMGNDLDPPQEKITVTGSDHFEVSMDNTSFSGNLELPYSDGELPSTTLYLRLKAGLDPGNYNHEEITVSGGGDEITIVASGEVGSSTLPYAHNFSGFADEHSLPFGWQVSDYTYLGDWGSGTSAGLRGNDQVLGYQHTSTTGTFVAELTLQNTNGKEIQHLFVSYLGRTHRSVGRSPEWEVSVNDQVVKALGYNTMDEEDKTKSALVQLHEPILPEAVFTLSWSSDRGEGSGASKQIGIADVFVSTIGDIPAEASLHVEGDVALDQSLTLKDLSIDEGNRLVVSPGANLEVTGTLVNTSLRDDATCGLIIRSDTQGTGSLIHQSEDVPAKMERHLPFGGWQFISAPVNDMEILGSSFAPDTDVLPTHFDFYSFDESEDTYPWINLRGNNAIPNEDFDQYFNPAKGYLVAYFEEGNKDEETTFPQNPFTFKGKLNSGNITYDLQHNNTPQGIQGWNLVGNPYPSAIDWGEIDKSDLDNDFAYVYDGEANNYVTVENGNIAAHQGFFVKTKEAGGSLQFTDEIRRHEGSYTKSSDYLDEDKIVISLFNNEMSDVATLRVLENTTFTQGRRDALKLFSFSDEMPQVFTMTEDQQRVAIQSIPYIDPQRHIPIGLRLPENADYVVTIDEISGAVLNYTIWLKDKQTGDFLKLHAGKEYPFAGAEGINKDRFELHFTQTDLYAKNAEADDIHLWYHHERLYVNSNYHGSEMHIYDIRGRLLQSYQVDEGLNSIAPGLLPGIYVAVFSNHQGITGMRFVVP